ncbi:MAG TPA: hypothetical protein VHG89_09585 [Verrucomicrobiae bacterium]|nr:hypothetical protein [Verrucomicrobiae bacterium]
MKLSLAVLCLAMLTFFNAPAQVTVEVTLDQDQFLPSESLPATVRITNRSGQSLHLGADANWLTFGVESADGFIVVRHDDPPVIGEFDLGSSEVATKRVDLAPYFVLTQSGRYRIIATIHIKDWNTDITSAPCGFDIIHGAKLWSQTFGVPGGPSNQPPEVRKYTLEQANYLRSQLRLYVQVSDDSESRVFKVETLGKMVSFGRPEAQLDRLSSLHVLWQNGGAVFTYAVVNPNGEILETEIYDYVNTRPRLSANDNGDIIVVGGVKRVKAETIPAVKAPNEMPAPAKS